MSPEHALASVRNRDRARLQVLENERDQGWPPKFDWRRWRLRNEMVVAGLPTGDGRWNEDERALFAPLIALVHKAGDNG